jgi:hypothetical protein
MFALCASCSFSPATIPGRPDDGGITVDRDAPSPNVNRDGSVGEIDGDVTLDIDATISDASPPDASSTPPCDALACAAAGGLCNLAGDRCVIDSVIDGDPIVCPADMFCEVNCMGPDACKQDGVDCGSATGCDVSCTGVNACQSGGVTCGSGDCTVSCVGVNACQAGVSCASSSCEVTCDGENACQGGISCMPAADCTAHCCGSNACQGSTCACSVDGVCP